MEVILGDQGMETTIGDFRVHTTPSLSTAWQLSAALRLEHCTLE